MTISLEILQKQMESQFELICFVDLADVSKTHAAMFTCLQTAHRTTYLPNQRLVFYSSHKLSQDLINHLQLAAGRIDVANWFIVVCCPNNIQKELAVANQLHGHDNINISWIFANLTDTKPLLKFGFIPRTSFCPLPFGSVYVNQPGAVAPCCKFKGVAGDINNNTLNEIFHGSIMTNLRKQIQQGATPAECSSCWKSENLGSISLRQHAINKYQDQMDHSWIDDLRIHDVTVSPSTLCNFKCRICGPEVSSQHAVEAMKHTSNPKEISYLKDLIKLSQWDSGQFEKSLHELNYDFENLHIMGGEPLLLPTLADQLEKIIHSGHAKKMQLELTTNVSQYPEKIMQLFNHFKKVELLLSVDNIGARFEIERGGSWPDIAQNISRFAKMNSDHISVKFNVTVNIQNLLYLDEVVDLAKQENVDINWKYLEYPRHLCINNVTQLVKESVYKKYHNHANMELQKIALRVQLTESVNGQEFINNMTILDRRRQQQFSQTHSEIFREMGHQFDSK